MNENKFQCLLLNESLVEVTFDLVHSLLICALVNRNNIIMNYYENPKATQI